MNYQPHLDGLRAIAVLLVVGNHMPFDNIGIKYSSGVDIFFALSGWLITRMLVAEYRTAGHISLARFYIRRLFRIVPLYALTIALYGAIAWLLGGSVPARSYWAEFKGVLPYLASFNDEFRPDSLGTVFGQAWSLGIEEKFYLIWPLVLGLALAAPRLRKRALLALAGLVPIAVGLAIGNDQIVRGYAGLAAGAFLAVWMAPPLRTGLAADPAASRFDPVEIALAVLVAGLIAVPAVPISRWTSVAIAGATAVLIARLQWRISAPSLVRQALSTPLLALIGRLSYAIYLFHVLCKHAVEKGVQSLLGSTPGWALVAGTMLLSVAVAQFLRATVEQPLIGIGRGLALRLFPKRAAVVPVV